MDEMSTEHKYIWWLPVCVIAILILNYLDMVSTVLVINEFGLEAELNPILRRAIMWSPLITWMIKIVTVSAAALFMLYSVERACLIGGELQKKSIRYSKIACCIIVPFMSLLCISNFIQLYGYIYIWK